MRSFICFFWIISTAAMLTSCSTSTQTWEDMKTAGRHMQRGVDSLWGKEYESRMLDSDDEFIGPEDGEFIALNELDLKTSLTASDLALPQPKGSPGQKGIPMLSAFYSVGDSLMGLLQPLHFQTDEFVLKDSRELHSILEIASYLKKNPNVFLLVSGHCDERASAGYNIALGMRRANYIRSLLVKNGVDLNRIYTVSRGKEEPIALGHSPDDWKQNRRAEFKIYEK
jgi:peptidoglycan-associated lipoprotein